MKKIALEVAGEGSVRLSYMDEEARHRQRTMTTRRCPYCASPYIDPGGKSVRWPSLFEPVGIGVQSAEECVLAGSILVRMRADLFRPSEDLRDRCELGRQRPRSGSRASRRSLKLLHTPSDPWLPARHLNLTTSEASRCQLSGRRARSSLPASRPILSASSTGPLSDVSTDSRPSGVRTRPRRLMVPS